MDNAAFIEVFVQFIIYDGEIQLKEQNNSLFCTKIYAEREG